MDKGQRRRKRERNHTREWKGKRRERFGTK